ASSQPMPLDAPVIRAVGELLCTAVSSRSGRPLQPVGKHFLVEPVPLALEALVAVVFELEFQKIDELRICAFDLLARGPVMIRQVVASTVLEGAIDQDAEVGRGLLERLWLVRRVNIEDDAGVPLFGPRQETL